MPDGPGDRRVVVTGARGFIGAHLVRRLAAAGDRVYPVARSDCDLRDPGATDALIRGIRPHVVAHLAGHVSGRRDLAAVAPTLADNLVGTVNLLTAAAEHGVDRVVLAGSIEEPHLGEATMTPSSPYAAAKWAASAYARLFNELWALPTVVLRVAMVYGPDQPDLRKLIPHVITSLLADRAPEIGSGLREVDWVYVDDVVEAFVAATDAPRAPGTILEIGSGDPVPIRRVVELAAELVGTGPPPRFGAVGDRPLDTARIADPRAAAAVLGWRPQVGLAQGLARTVDWYRREARCGTGARPGGRSST